MSLTDCGPAIVLIYGGGRREAALVHEHDGGEAYMRPLLRKAVQYAKTHYNSGDMKAVLMSEGEMKPVDDIAETARETHVRHVYYVTYKWDADMASKTYRVRALHLPEKRYATAEQLVEYAEQIPDSAAQLT